MKKKITCKHLGTSACHKCSFGNWPCTVKVHVTDPSEIKYKRNPQNKKNFNNEIPNCNSAWHIKRVLERQVQLQLAIWKLNKSPRRLNKPELQSRTSRCFLAHRLHSEAMVIQVTLCLEREIFTGGREIGRKGQKRPKIGRSPAKTGVLAGLCYISQ